MIEDRRKKKREYARRAYQKQCEDLEKGFFKSYGITPTMDKEKVLKKISKDWLMAVFAFGKVIGGELSRRKHKEQAKGLEQMFKRQFLPTLTRKLKKAGVLPLPAYGKKKAI